MLLPLIWCASTLLNAANLDLVEQKVVHLDGYHLVVNRLTHASHRLFACFFFIEYAPLFFIHPWEYILL